jgi:hypothetical protein
MTKLLAILTSDGFNERFEQNLRKFSLPQKNVYELTEKEHESLIGKRHYASFDSFRKVRTRKMNS